MRNTCALVQKQKWQKGATIKCRIIDGIVSFKFCDTIAEIALWNAVNSHVQFIQWQCNLWLKLLWSVHKYNHLPYNHVHELWMINYSLCSNVRTHNNTPQYTQVNGWIAHSKEMKLSSIFVQKKRTFAHAKSDRLLKSCQL